MPCPSEVKDKLEKLIKDGTDIDCSGRRLPRTIVDDGGIGGNAEIRKEMKRKMPFYRKRRKGVV